MIIRQAVKDDLPAILELYRVLAGLYTDVHETDNGQCETAWERIAKDKRQQLLVAEADGKVVGTLNLTIIPNLGHGGQPWAAIDNVAVAEQCRGQGIGAALLQAAGSRAKEQNCYKVILSSNMARERAHEFYRRLGWKQTHIGFSLELK